MKIFYRLLSTALFLAVPTVGAFAQSAPALLPPDQAFTMRMADASDGYVSVIFHVAPGYRLYRDRVNVTTPTPGRMVYAVLKPPGTMVYDAALGKSIETYDTDFRVDVSISPTRPTDLIVRIQGCAIAAGVCYPPVERKFHLSPRG
ncbi:protein-disulfide reductase DsbD N-terminal domain-containing protein [Burkholderia pseudomallei]|uniref:Disulfide bond corrector DsbC family protein n=1 Tax=Burkholderia pseudomallei TaxID=28450 RepID=A0AA40MF77_BURPE|nr:protein-disulfide reductase DsbD N-terminal domain-containing protein [Burkholderia pseudomallei]KGS77540.1 disulfide bond corrector DsbC family protein [Burkholderia pseudomallei MSHR5596]KGX17279.1 disulfide bond corrector DsbC family protein [Burkholderia pseudomallei]